VFWFRLVGVNSVKVLAGVMSRNTNFPRDVFCALEPAESLLMCTAAFVTRAADGVGVAWFPLPCPAKAEESNFLAGAVIELNCQAMSLWVVLGKVQSVMAQAAAKPMLPEEEVEMCKRLFAATARADDSAKEVEHVATRGGQEANDIFVVPLQVELMPIFGRIRECIRLVPKSFC
jgi:hypothetical protein